MSINDNDPVIAGLDEISVLSAVVTVAAARRELECRVGGWLARASNAESLEWIERGLRGDDPLAAPIERILRADSSVTGITVSKEA